MSTGERYVRFFSEVGIGDVGRVGGKNASLGEMYRELAPEGVRVPNGFATTAQAYWYVLERAGAMSDLRKALTGHTNPQLARRRRFGSSEDRGGDIARALALMMLRQFSGGRGRNRAHR